jgi:hypothetical protein
MAGGRDTEDSEESVQGREGEEGMKHIETWFNEKAESGSRQLEKP